MKAKEQFLSIVKQTYDKSIDECSDEQLYYALLAYVKSCANHKKRYERNKKLYYLSAEFLIGKLLSNNLINLGVYAELEQVFLEHGKSLNNIEDIEPEPSLGNGGLGRLAACFLDSIATLGLAGDGIGLNYHFGLFKQQFKDHIQQETKNAWMEKHSWLNETKTCFQVRFGTHVVTSILYDIDVIGYENGVNKLHLFDIKTVDEHIVNDGICFDQKDIDRNLTLFLYPDDSTKDGEYLRIYQQYFLVSNAAQMILKEEKTKGHDLHKLYEHVVIQINDTHPTMIIPELISLLMQEGIHMGEAISIVQKTCAYTNHTILSEALETWPIQYLRQVVPQLIPIIEVLQLLIAQQYNDERVQIIDSYDRVHMAHIDLHYGFSVNGVAALHTDILKHTELKAFYDIYPDKFNNKTNGITFRRWLLHCNPQLCTWISSHIGEGYKKDASQLEKLLSYRNDTHTLASLMHIKQRNKDDLKAYLKETQDIDINEHSIFDIQIKRIHEYKRQQMYALYIIYKYLEIKKGKLPTTPITFLLGGKAAPAYILAKDILHLFLCLQTLLEQDEEVNPYIKLVMVENYNVSKAEKLIPACDISEQISLASKEASGTGNMKLMLNGAITLGTRDGANVEIEMLVGKANMYVFGESSKDVITHYEKGDYTPQELYQDPCIQPLVDFIIGKELLAIGHKENLERLYKDIVQKDWFMTLLDVKDYIRVKNKMLEDYKNQEAWAKKALTNIAKAGYFSSDRTIAQYNEDIWKLT